MYQTLHSPNATSVSGFSSSLLIINRKKVPMALQIFRKNISSLKSKMVVELHCLIPIWLNKLVSMHLGAKKLSLRVREFSPVSILSRLHWAANRRWLSQSSQLKIWLISMKNRVLKLMKANWISIRHLSLLESARMVVAARSISKTNT